MDNSNGIFCPVTGLPVFFMCCNNSITVCIYCKDEAAYPDIPVFPPSINNGVRIHNLFLTPFHDMNCVKGQISFYAVHTHFCGV